MTFTAVVEPRLLGEQQLVRFLINSFFCFINKITLKLFDKFYHWAFLEKLVQSSHWVLDARKNARSRVYPCRPSRLSNGQCLLGTLWVTKSILSKFLLWVFINLALQTNISFLSLWCYFWQQSLFFWPQNMSLTSNRWPKTTEKGNHPNFLNQHNLIYFVYFFKYLNKIFLTKKNC